MKALISGVCGFIGSHLANRLMSNGHQVIGFDNLSRAGTFQNLQWLRQQPGSFYFVNRDLQDYDGISELFGAHSDISAVFHLAAQVAVTTSISAPRADFMANTLGTFNMLEATRTHCPKAAFLFSSTNKVYGHLEHFPTLSNESRYDYDNLYKGVNEETPLDFHSPYGCSKGSADQYVRDYSRIYGLNSVVLRQSCIYGSRQFGVEDQGWVAWFAICASLGRNLTIYGNGKQVRDMLWIDDLIDLYLKAISRIDQAKGNIYNVGGGPSNTLSVLEMVSLLERLQGRRTSYQFGEWRPGDQRIYVSDISKVRQHLNWSPLTSPEAGIRKLLNWISESKSLLQEVIPEYMSTDELPSRVFGP